MPKKQKEKHVIEDIPREAVEGIVDKRADREFRKRWKGKEPTEALPFKLGFCKFSEQGNFMICRLDLKFWDGGVASGYGVAKRNPSDTYNLNTAVSISTTRALDDILDRRGYREEG